MSKQWPRVKLGEILRLAARFEPREELTEYPFAGTYSFARGIFTGERKFGSTFALPKIQRIRKGDFVYCKIMAWEGAFGVVPEEADGCVMSGAFVVYELDRDRIDEKFINYFFKVPDHWQTIGKQSTGTNVRRQSLHPRQFEGSEIPLPPLSEQRRVVARIEALATQIYEAQKLRQEAAEEAEALSAASLVSLLPRNAATRLLGELLAPGRTMSYGVLVPGPDVDHGIPFVRIQDLAIKDAPILPNKRIAPEVDAQYVRTRLVGGEILIGVVGSIGKIGIAPQSWAGANIARAVCRIVPGPQVDRDYMAAVLSARPCQDYFRETTRTLAQPTLNVGQLAGTPIPVPPLPEQRRIVSELDALQAEVDALKRLQSETAAELDALLPTILDRAFKGEL